MRWQTTVQAMLVKAAIPGSVLWQRWRCGRQHVRAGLSRRPSRRTSGHGHTHAEEAQPVQGDLQGAESPARDGGAGRLRRAMPAKARTDQDGAVWPRCAVARPAQHRNARTVRASGNYAAGRRIHSIPASGQSLLPIPSAFHPRRCQEAGLGSHVTIPAPSRADIDAVITLASRVIVDSCG